nr:hypothetical protein [uncultured Romboutsia sp.]
MRKISEKLIKYDKYKICKFEDGNFFLATNDDVERIITACNDEDALIDHLDEIIRNYESKVWKK